MRVAHWKKDTADLATPAGWAEKLYTNLTYNYGFYADGSDLYLRLPGNRDPNTLYVTASGQNEVGLVVNGPDVRISGFEIRQFTSGIQVMWDARNAVVDRSLLTGQRDRHLLQGGNGPARPIGLMYGGDHTIQENLIQDASLWSADPVGSPTIPWMFVKSNIRNADGSDYPTVRIGGSGESTGISGRGGAQRVVVRRNTIDGPFNGVSPGQNDIFDRYAGQDMDVHDNLIRHLADDALEPEVAVDQLPRLEQPDRTHPDRAFDGTCPLRPDLPVPQHRLADRQRGPEPGWPGTGARVDDGQVLGQQRPERPSLHPAQHALDRWPHRRRVTLRSERPIVRGALPAQQPDPCDQLRVQRPALGRVRGMRTTTTSSPPIPVEVSSTTASSIGPQVQAYRNASGQGAHTNVAAASRPTFRSRTRRAAICACPVARR